MQSVVSTGVRFFSLLLWPNWGWVCWWSFCPCYYDRTELPVKGRACCWREGLGGRGRRGQNMPCSHFRIGGLCSCALCSTKVFFYNQNICTLNVGFRIFTNISAQQARVKIALVQDSLCAGLQPAKRSTDTLELPPALHAFRASPLPGFYPTFHDMDAIDDHNNPSNQIRTNWTFNTQTTIQPDAVCMTKICPTILEDLIEEYTATECTEQNYNVFTSALSNRRTQDNKTFHSSM